MKIHDALERRALFLAWQVCSGLFSERELNRLGQNGSRGGTASAEVSRYTVNTFAMANSFHTYQVYAECSLSAT